ncbi:MAG: Abi family protein [Candidatus Peribacteria bacterium]|nr:Abi family protein [Candidatus Peribacteria bacterium]
MARSVILQDYIFDQQLRILLFTYITHIETSFKNVFCQFACQKF